MTMQLRHAEIRTAPMGKIATGAKRMKNRQHLFEEVRHIPELLYPWFDEADRLEDGVLYIVDGAEQRDQMIQYNCPCGCGNAVMIPYYRQGEQKELTPSWAYREADGKVTLSPSIYSTGWSCRSHYFIRENRIVWC